ncbi:MAG: hypothetical protein JNJ54_00880 [Myxococcaceae bacterium]|nr:hypothetical protein [Myxococcaceae bacterium]
MASVHDAGEMWFDSPPRPTCLAHGRTAESVCLRCGVFQCEGCESAAADSLCHACAVLVTNESLPRLSRQAAWKLVFLPIVGIGCLVALLSSKGAMVRTLEHEQVIFLSAWLVPFACGLVLVVRPWAGAAFLGSLVALGLVLTALGPALIADFSGQRLVDLVLLAAAPLVAVKDAFALDRTSRRRALLETLAVA